MDEAIPLCAHCDQPMQLAETIYDGDKPIAKRYVCGCQIPPHHHNVHAGQAGVKP